MYVGVCECSNPPTIAFGTPQPNFGPFTCGVTTVRYTCNQGYELIGSSTITCLSTGQYSGPPPRCQVPRKCLSNIKLELFPSCTKLALLVYVSSLCFSMINFCFSQNKLSLFINFELNVKINETRMPFIRRRTIRVTHRSQTPLQKTKSLIPFIRH